MQSSQAPAIPRPLLVSLWSTLCQRLAEWDPGWRERIKLDSPRALVRSCTSGPPVSNQEAFEAFGLALLSGNTRWDRIARIRDELGEPFDRFRPGVFAVRSDDDIRESVLGWFRERQAGAPRLGSALLRLRATARILSGGGDCESAAAFLAAACAQSDGSPEQLAMLLGNSKEWKLPGFGVALAAEGLRNLGFDLCKPDRHIMRAVGSWGLVDFRSWNQKGPYTAPQGRPAEMLACMLAVRSLAQANGYPVTKTNSAIWIAGAVSGARLTNEKFREMAPEPRRP